MPSVGRELSKEHGVPGGAPHLGCLVGLWLLWVWAAHVFLCGPGQTLGHQPRWLKPSRQPAVGENPGIFPLNCGKVGPSD